MCRSKALRRLIAALLIATLLLSVCAPSALASYNAKVNSNTKVYNVPSTSGKGVAVPKGLSVTVTAISGSWARISYKGVTAYIPLSRLNMTTRVAAYTAKSTPVYRQPSSSSAKMGTLSIATKVYVVGKSGSYYRVQNSSGSVTGYIKSGYLTTKAKLTAAYNAYKKAKEEEEKKKEDAPIEKSSSALISIMKSLVGKSYSTSATLSSAPKSFNCSTFVSYVMKKFDIATKDSAQKQANDSSMAKVTSISKLQPGDILCFDGDDEDGECDHTAIYAGGGVFYEASQTAKKVQKNSFSAYYKSHFLWARRP